uniref:Uncharacterized protein n=1 Tax=Anguilla anguilla TaxID=7936 RepID=A0A0E9SQ48_ANGAN
MYCYLSKSGEWFFLVLSSFLILLFP